MSDLLAASSLTLPFAMFGFVFCAWMAVLLLVSRSRDESEANGGSGTMVRALIDGNEESFQLLEAPGEDEETDFVRYFRRAGIVLPRNVLVARTVIAVAASFLLGAVISGSILIGLVVTAILIGGLAAFIGMKAARRRDLMERQCVTALRLASRSLRAGHPISGMMRVLAERVPDPVQKYFIEIVQREELGEPTDDSIRAVLMNAETNELRSFGTALLVQIEAGGNLTETIDRLCTSITDRIRLMQRNRALSAHMRFTVRLMVLLPILIVIVFGTISTEYSQLLFGSQIGRLLLVGAVLLLIAGSVAVARVLRLEDRGAEVPS